MQTTGRKLLEIVLDIRADNFDTQDFIDTIDQEYPGFDITQQVIDIYVNLHNNTRLMVNRAIPPMNYFESMIRMMICRKPFLSVPAFIASFKAMK